MQTYTPSTPASIIMAFVSFVLSFLGFCNGPDANSNIITEIVNDKAIEIVLSTDGEELNTANLLKTKTVLDNRLSYLAAEVEILADNRFLLKLASSSLDEQDSIISLATRPGILRFRIVKDEYSDLEELDLDMLEPSPFDKKIVTNAKASIDEYSARAMVSFEITKNEQEKFADFTEQNISKKLAVVLDSEVLIAPVLQGRISGTAQITGLDSLAQAEEYARIFNSGELPFGLNLDEIRINTKID